MSLFSIYGCDKLYVPIVGHLVTTKCNLDCKGCLNFTHVNPIKRHYEYEVLKEDIDKFFRQLIMLECLVYVVESHFYIRCFQM